VGQVHRREKLEKDPYKYVQLIFNKDLNEWMNQQAFQQIEPIGDLQVRKRRIKWMRRKGKKRVSRGRSRRIEQRRGRRRDQEDHSSKPAQVNSL
jgi:hypothetical protein